MLHQIFTKIVWRTLTLWLIVTGLFFFVRLAPRGPFDGEREMPDAVKAAIAAKYRLDQPLHVQYAHYMKGLVHLDFGPSYHHQGRTVQSLIAEGLPTTLKLGACAMSLAVIIGMLAGIIAAVRHNRFTDYGIMAIAMVGVAVPEFVVAPLAGLVLAVWLKWLPPQGWGELRHMVLPVMTLTVYYCAVLSRMTRGGMLEVLQQDFIRTARAKGLSEWQVVIRHALQGGITPAVTYLGVAMAFVFTSGALVVETFFNIPGIARYFLEGAKNSNYPLALGCCVIIATFVIVNNTLVDLAYLALDPRQRRKPR